MNRKESKRLNSEQKQQIIQFAMYNNEATIEVLTDQYIIDLVKGGTAAEKEEENVSEPKLISNSEAIAHLNLVNSYFDRISHTAPILTRMILII